MAFVMMTLLDDLGQDKQSASSQGSAGSLGRLRFLGIEVVIGSLFVLALVVLIWASNQVSLGGSYTGRIAHNRSSNPERSEEACPSWLALLKSEMDTLPRRDFG
jgi:hypothetical protein